MTAHQRTTVQVYTEKRANLAFSPILLNWFLFGISEKNISDWKHTYSMFPWNLPKVAKFFNWEKILYLQVQQKSYKTTKQNTKTKKSWRHTKNLPISVECETKNYKLIHLTVSQWITKDFSSDILYKIKKKKGMRVQKRLSVALRKSKSMLCK